MHYNIVLFNEKLLMHYATFALLFVTRAGLAYLFFSNKKTQSYIFGNCKGSFPYLKK